MASLGAAIALWLLLAAALGLGTGWLLWGWWANRPPADLPTDEELLRLRSDLELAREQVADLRAALAEAGVGTAAPTTRPAGTKRSAPPPPVTRPHDVTDSDGDWGSGAFLLAARAQELASLPDLQEHGRVGGGPTTAGSLRAVHGITVKVERALQRRGVQPRPVGRAVRRGRRAARRRAGRVPGPHPPRRLGGPGAAPARAGLTVAGARSAGATRRTGSRRCHTVWHVPLGDARHRRSVPTPTPRRR